MPNPRVFPDGIQVIPPGSNTPVFNVDRQGNVYSATGIWDAVPGGSLILNNAQNDVDIVFKSDTNPEHYVSNAGAFSGVGAHGFGDTPAASSYFQINPAKNLAITNVENLYRFSIGNQATAVVASGNTHNVIASALFAEPNIDNSGTVTTAATVIVQGAPTEGTNNYALLTESGNTRFRGPMQTAQGANVTAATTISFGSDGNLYPIVGTTAITLITTTGWEDGSVVYLKFNSAGATLTNNATASGLTANILMGSAGTYTSRANDIVCLILTSTGTSSKAWIMASGAL